MKNKQLTILCIVLLSVLVVCLSLFMIFGFYYNGKGTAFFSKTSHKLLEESFVLEEIKEIEIYSRVSDVRLEESETDKIEVIVYGIRDEDAAASIKGDKLVIEDVGKGSFCFGFCYDQREVIVKIPNNQIPSLTVKTSAGDVHAKNIVADQAQLKTVSGDILFGKGKDVTLNSTSGDVILGEALKANVKTVSGEISINKISTEAKVTTVSGDINIKNFMVQENSQIKTVSGSVHLHKVSDAYIDVKTVSGDSHIKQNNRKSNVEIKIQTTSGDIKTN